MANINIGYLLKKRNVKFNNRNIEIFEFIDYVTGITFCNKDKINRCNIISGNYSGIYASFMSKLYNEEEYVFVSDNLENSIKNNDNKVNFKEIRTKKMNNTSKYYMRDLNGTDLVKVVNKDLLDYLNKKNEFDERDINNSSDIASIYSRIKETIISQDEQIMQILTTLFKNQKIVNSQLNNDLVSKLKENIIIYGPTGTGKTEILKRISKIYNIPIVIEDATSLSETGYIGRNITDMLEDLYHASDNNIKLAQKGILVIDEFDKLAEKKEDGKSHVSREGVQRSLLKLLDGSLFYFNNIKFDTSELTIIGLGAFTGITNDNNYKNITPQDFINYGIMKELIARFSKTIPMNHLSKDSIIKIIKESNFSPINTYRELFKILNIKYDFDDSFIEYIAEIAVLQNNGARSIKTIFDNCISSALFKIFAGEYSSIKLIAPKENGNAYILKK